MHTSYIIHLYIHTRNDSNKIKKYQILVQVPIDPLRLLLLSRLATTVILVNHSRKTTERKRLGQPV